MTGKQNGAVQVWDARAGKEVQTLGTHTHGREIRGVVFSRAGGHLASVSGDGVVNLWDATRLDQKQPVRQFTDRAHVPGPFLNVAFSPDGRRLASGGEKNTVKIWDVPTRPRAAHPRGTQRRRLRRRLQPRRRGPLDRLGG